MISYEDFAKVEIKAGKIVSAEKIPDTDKLLRLMVDFNESVEVEDELGNKTVKKTQRQIVSGISIYFPDTTTLVGRICMFITNLEPRVMKGIKSEGMLLAAVSGGGKDIVLLSPEKKIDSGSKVQ